MSDVNNSLVCIRKHPISSVNGAVRCRYHHSPHWMTNAALTGARSPSWDPNVNRFPKIQLIRAVSISRKKNEYVDSSHL
uniref:Uncharacterized protein n=1 Tax=Pararge aegeria TaxID=116150 RepID=S4NWV9_9NEOP